jgi:hypothetical protein
MKIRGFLFFARVQACLNTRVDNKILRRAAGGGIYFHLQGSPSREHGVIPGKKDAGSGGILFSLNEKHGVIYWCLVHGFAADGKGDIVFSCFFKEGDVHRMHSGT